jgi:hypothetical protein
MEAVACVREQIPGELSDEERQRLMEAVESDLSNLHEGNIACFRLRPSEFKSWKENWR